MDKVFPQFLFNSDDLWLGEITVAWLNNEASQS